MAATETPEVGLDQVAAAGEDVVVVGVLDRARGHVPGAVLIPMGRLSGRMSGFDRSRPVYMVCASGNRSSAMTGLLRSSGLDAHSGAGGTNAWIRTGRPIEKGNR